MVAGTDSYSMTERERLKAYKKARAKANGEKAATGNNEAFGLTKREYMATHIMAGLAAYDDGGVASLEAIASDAVRWADALLLELEQ
jgi:hypothetical protein